VTVFSTTLIYSEAVKMYNSTFRDDTISIIFRGWMPWWFFNQLLDLTKDVEETIWFSSHLHHLICVLRNQCSISSILQVLMKFLLSTAWRDAWAIAKLAATSSTPIRIILVLVHFAAKNIHQQKHLGCLIYGILGRQSGSQLCSQLSNVMKHYLFLPFFRLALAMLLTVSFECYSMSSFYICTTYNFRSFPLFQFGKYSSSRELMLLMSASGLLSTKGYVASFCVCMSCPVIARQTMIRVWLWF
jgi:hypothetical protein